MIYLVLTFAFTGLIMLIGIPLWDSLNLVMTTIATGGFTLHQSGLAYYHNPLLEILLIPVMIAGAMPFKIFFLLYNGKVRDMFRNQTVRILLLIAFLGSLDHLHAISTCSAISPSNLRSGRVLSRQSPGSVPAACRIRDIHHWPAVPLAVLTMMVFIGGAMGSTAGGIKVNRLAVAYAGVRWWFRRFFVSSRVIVP